jgi:hypothetical protein
VEAVDFDREDNVMTLIETSWPIREQPCDVTASKADERHRKWPRIDEALSLLNNTGKPRKL